MSEPGASTSQSEASSDIDVEAATLLSQGRRNLLVGDPPSAVQCLQEACELLGTKYGELANECGESYYYYGWALLDLARMETGVLGNALEGVPEDTGEETEDENIENPDKVEGEERDKIFHEVQDALEDKKEKEAGSQESETDKENASEKDDAKAESEKEPATASEGERGLDKPSSKAETPKDEPADKPAPKVETPKDEPADKPAPKVETPKDEPADKPAPKVETPKDEPADKPDPKVETPKDEPADKPDPKVETKKEEPEAATEGDKAVDKSSPEGEKKVEKGKEDEEGGKDEDKAGETAMEVDDAGKAESKKDVEGDGKDKKEGKDEGAGPSGNAEGGDDDKVDEGGEEEEEGGAGEEDGAAATGEETKDEDVSNFQLSWEMLEIARVIFSKQGEEFKLKVSQVYLKLGELGLETGNYPQSVEDFSQCLTRQKEMLSNDSRLLAETYYNLALAYSFDQKFDKAIENFGESTAVIENRIASLNKKIKTEKYESEEDKLQDQKEVKELLALIPEIKVKIEDAKCEKKSAESAVGQAMRSAAAQFGLGTSSSSSGGSCSAASTAQPIAVRKPTDAKPDDISHLVHRKRKPEDVAEQETAGKKSRQEQGGGDAATTNGTNGVEQTAMNGDTKLSPEKPEIKVKQVEQTTSASTETATMET